MSRLTTPGSNTLHSEIAAPHAAVPASKAGSRPAGRQLQGPHAPAGEHRHGTEQHLFGAEPACQHRRERGKHAEQRHRHGGEHHDRPGRKPGVGRHFGSTAAKLENTVRRFSPIRTRQIPKYASCGGRQRAAARRGRPGERRRPNGPTRQFSQLRSPAPFLQARVFTPSLQSFLLASGPPGRPRDPRAARPGKLNYSGRDERIPRIPRPAGRPGVRRPGPDPVRRAP